ncbi:hypothetical protein HPB51_008341 [Rhipicephalus microplus]|uniref:DNA ligase ATP-dependent N-terminal domain-containing protein n=1 Tax=Rhipicephalus microplus TaxID=6941 RepID=A0A9J6ES42_RHIMP|nr:hypothetical protein HPB51_008341 [Rhipicephalus microplus]
MCSSRATGFWRCIVVSACSESLINGCDRHGLAVCSSRRSFFKTSTASKVVKEEPPKAVKEEPPAADATPSPEKDVNGLGAMRDPVDDFKISDILVYGSGISMCRRDSYFLFARFLAYEVSCRGTTPMEAMLEEFARVDDKIEPCAKLTDDEVVLQVLEDGDANSDNEKPETALPARAKLARALMVLSTIYSGNVTLADVKADILVRQRYASQKHIQQVFKPLARKSAKRSPEPNRLSTESDAKRVKTEPTSEKEPSSQEPSSPADEEVEVKKEKGKKDKEKKEEKGKKKKVDDKKATKASPPVKKEVKEEKPSAMSKSSPPKDEKAKEKPKAEKKLQNFAFTTSGKSDQKSSAASQVCDYNPDKANYDPVEDACWKKGAKVPYLALAITLDKIDGISGRLRIIEVLSNFLRSVLTLSPDDLLSAVYLCLNKIAPDYEGLELGIGESLLVKALAEATGRTPDKVRAEAAAKGDLGLVAESSRSQQRVLFPPPPLMLSHVFTKLRTIAEMTGNSVRTNLSWKHAALPSHAGRFAVQNCARMK